LNLLEGPLQRAQVGLRGDAGAALWVVYLAFGALTRRRRLCAAAAAADDDDDDDVGDDGDEAA